MVWNPGPGIVLTLIVVVVGVTLYTFLKGRHVERMKQLEKGIAPSSGPSYLEIKIGMLLVGIGAGLITAFLVNRLAFLNEEGVLYPAFIFLMGGLGLFASYFVAEHFKKDS
jgi:hypothetical protein